MNVSAKPKFLTLCLMVSLCGCASVFPSKAKDVAVDHKQRHDELIASFEQKRDHAQFEAAMVRWQEGDAAGCKELIDKMLARSPSHRRGRLLRAELRLIDGKPQLALADIEKLVAENDTDAEACHMLGLLLEASGQQAEAVEMFERAVAIDPKSQVFATSYHSSLVDEDATEAAVATDDINSLRR